MTIVETIKYYKSELSTLYPQTEIQSFLYIIFEHLLKYSKIDIHTRQNEVLSNEIDEKIRNCLDDLKKYRPIQHIIGETEFYELIFSVNESTLVPRPETEELVDLIIKENTENNLKILDIGTGSGCIAITLAKNISQSNVYAYDISAKALEIAKKNAIRNNVMVDFSEFDILKNYKLKVLDFDIIVSNPPYVTEKEKTQILANVLDYEPHSALFVSNENPLIFYERIADFALINLKSKGKLYFEINEQFGLETKQLLEKKDFINTRIIQDINRKDRFVVGEKR